MADKFYITTAIPYASQKPHFGNTYEVIMTDCIARYKKQRGYDVFFCTGTDEHGKKIENAAAEAGMSPKEYADGVTKQIRAVWDLVGADYDRFIRTTDEDHVAAVQTILQKFYDNGDIYKGYYEGWYCEPDESFYTDTQLVDGKCPDCGREVKRAKEETYYFRMSKYTKRLIDYIESHPGFIEPEGRKKEMLNNFLIPGLQDLCISRTSFTWGVPLPFDPKHVSYVWVDALSNYITALGYRADLTYDEQPERFRKFWPADCHVIGKDILRFHTIYWPIFLMALDLPLPEKVFGHPWFNFGVNKMSKSRGNVVYADDLAQRFGVDGVRWYALAEMPYATDGSITYESVIARYNTDLANNLGNLVNRTIAMTKKYFDGVVPAPGAEEGPDAELKAVCLQTVADVCAKLDSYRVADACSAITDMLSRANKYIDETTPWILAKTDEGKIRLATVIYNLLEAIRFGACLLAPFIPSTSDAIIAQLGTDKRGYSSLGAFGALEPGKAVGEPSVLFARIDEKAVLAEIEAERAAKEEPARPPKPEGPPQITIDDFMGVELRTAQVVACEAVPKAKKLLKLTVDLGYETRTVVSGIAKFYKPEDLAGKKIALVANLKPATLCGIESNGMILASGEENVRVVFLADDTPLGERIR